MQQVKNLSEKQFQTDVITDVTNNPISESILGHPTVSPLP